MSCSDAECREAPCKWRKTGRTCAAAAHPLDAGGVRVMAAHNGVGVPQLPETFLFASNAYMKRWFDRLGARMEAGLPTTTGGRWLTPTELDAAET